MGCSCREGTGARAAPSLTEHRAGDIGHARQIVFLKGAGFAEGEYKESLLHSFPFTVMSPLLVTGSVLVSTGKVQLQKPRGLKTAQASILMMLQSASGRLGASVPHGLHWVMLTNRAASIWNVPLQGKGNVRD